MTQSTDELVQGMAMVLTTLGTDLGDDRDVIRALIGARYKSGDVTALMDRAVEHARAAAQHSEAMSHG